MLRNPVQPEKEGAAAALVPPARFCFPSMLGLMQPVTVCPSGMTCTRVHCRTHMYFRPFSWGSKHKMAHFNYYLLEKPVVRAESTYLFILQDNLSVDRFVFLVQSLVQRQNQTLLKKIWSTSTEAQVPCWHLWRLYDPGTSRALFIPIRVCPWTAPLMLTVVSIGATPLHLWVPQELHPERPQQEEEEDQWRWRRISGSWCGGAWGNVDSTVTHRDVVFVWRARRTCTCFVEQRKCLVSFFCFQCWLLQRWFLLRHH